MKEELESNSPEDKESRLLNSAFKLFIEKGINNTSIQEIVDAAQVGKGTFYLYFKDKYEIRDLLVELKSKQLFSDAIYDLKEQNISSAIYQLIFIFDHVINNLVSNPSLLKFIGKDLASGIYTRIYNKIYEDDDSSYGNELYEVFIKGLRDNHLLIPNPDITLYMLVNLLGSSIYNIIMYEDPMPIDEYKNYLFDVVTKLLTEQ